MDWGRISDWKGWRLIHEWAGRPPSLLDWDRWRRFSPAAGSLLAHGVVGLAIVSMFGASTKPRRAAPVLPSPELQVTLVAETPMPSTRPSATARPPTPDAEPIPGKPRTARPRKEELRTPEATDDASDPEAVYLPPSILSNDGVPLGLQGLVNADRCNPRKGLKPKDCGTDWSTKVEQAGAWQTASKDELRQHYAEFMPVCRYKVGCESSDGVLLNGTRSFGLKSPMASGAGGLQGIHDVVGRLGFNPDHTDPGFGD